MRDDHFGTADNPRNAERKEDQSSLRRVEEEITISDQLTDAGRSDDELEKQEEEVIKGVALAAAKSWSGLIPSPEDFKQYDPDTQAKIIQWTDAQVLDESKRQDKLVDAATKSTARDQWLSFTLNMTFVTFSLVSLLITGEAMSFGFLAVPGLVIAVNVISKIRKSGDD